MYGRYGIDLSSLLTLSEMLFSVTGLTCYVDSIFVRLCLTFFFLLPGLAFAYSQSPLYLQGVVMGLNLATIGIGFYVAGALAAIAKKASGDTWYPQDLNDGKLENYFFFLAAVMFLNFLVFVFIARKYKYVELSRTRKSLTVQKEIQQSQMNSSIDSIEDNYS